MDVNTLPLVSIALTTFNGEKYLAAQLDSIINQTYKNIEIVIADDASTDNTIDVIKAYATKDTRISYITHKENVGFNKNFLRAMHACNGSFIAISDQDDIWHTDKLMIMMKNYDETSLLMHCNSVKFSGSVNLLLFNQQQRNKRFYGNIGSKLVFVNSVEGHCIVFKKELVALIQPIPDNVYYDWWMGIIAADNGGVQWIPETLVLRRIHESNAYEKNAQLKISKLNDHKNHATAFANCTCLTKKTRAFAQTTVNVLSNNPTFIKLFPYLLKNSSYIFYYKNATLGYMSQIKNAYKLALRLLKP
jgi:glycosyltransferase involved in cell wall biosynthesis